MSRAKPKSSRPVTSTHDTSGYAKMIENLQTAKSPETRDRHRQMMLSYFVDGLSLAALETKYGYSNKSLTRIMRQATLMTEGALQHEPVKAKDPRRMENRRPLSPMHQSLALNLRVYRVKHSLSLTQLGQAIGMTRARISELESASYDVTLVQILRIAELTGINLNALLNIGNQMEKAEAA